MLLMDGGKIFGLARAPGRELECCTRRRRPHRERKAAPVHDCRGGLPGPFRSRCYLPFRPASAHITIAPTPKNGPAGTWLATWSAWSASSFPSSTLMGRIAHRRAAVLRGRIVRRSQRFIRGDEIPARFHSVMAESPSLWSGEGRFLEEYMKTHDGAKIFIGTGTREYSYTTMIGKRSTTCCCSTVTRQCRCWRRGCSSTRVDQRSRSRRGGAHRVRVAAACTVRCSFCADTGGER